jgi:hypothetical protein
MTVTAAIPVVNAKAKAKITAIFFMISPSSPKTLPEPATPIGDRHHELEVSVAF